MPTPTSNFELPMVPVTGKQADIHAAAWQQWRDNGYDNRILEQAGILKVADK